MSQTKLPIDELKNFEAIPDDQLLNLTGEDNEILSDTFAKEPPPEPVKPERKKREPKTPPKAQEPPQVNIFNDEEYSKEPGPQPGPQPGPTTKVNVADIIDSELAVDLFDKLMSVLVPMGLNAVGDMKLKPSDMAATHKEKQTLKGPVHNALRTLNLDLSNPWVALSFTVVVIYGGKAAVKVNFEDEDFVKDESGDDPKPHYTNKKAYAAWYRRNRKK